LEKFSLLVNFSDPNPLHPRSGMEVDSADFDGSMDRFAAKTKAVSGETRVGRTGER
jgi:hypothetical protein